MKKLIPARTFQTITLALALCLALTLTAAALAQGADAVAPDAAAPAADTQDV